MDEWVGTVIAAAITAIGAGVAIVLGSRLKGEWWPGDLRKAKQINELLEKLDDGSVTARVLARERDEALQSWMMRDRVERSFFTEMAIPFLFVSMVAIVLGFGTLMVLGIVDAISRVWRADTADIGWSAALLIAAGVTVLLLAIPFAVIGLRRQGREYRAVRRYFRFGSTTSTDLSRALEHARRSRRKAVRRLRRQRAPWRWFRKESVPASSAVPGISMQSSGTP